MTRVEGRRGVPRPDLKREGAPMKVPRLSCIVLTCLAVLMPVALSAAPVAHHSGATPVVDHSGATPVGAQRYLGTVLAQ